MKIKRLLPTFYAVSLLSLLITTPSNASSVTPAVVAVLDYTGINSSHPELTGQVLVEICMNPSAGSTPRSVTYMKSQDIFSCPGDLPFVEGVGAAATQFINGKTSFYGSNSHGTSVASVVVGRTVGINKKAKIIAIRPLGDYNLALQWVVDNKEKYGITTLVMSMGTEIKDKTALLGCPKPGFLSRLGINNSLKNTSNLIAALRTKDVAPFFIAGNNGAQLSISSPACIDGAISVGASVATNNSKLASYSNSALALDIIAPGTMDVANSGPMEHFVETSSGTSLAAPYAAAVYSNVKSMYPLLTQDQILSAMRTTGKKVNTSWFTGLRTLDVPKLMLFLTKGTTIPSLESTYDKINAAFQARFPSTVKIDAERARLLLIEVDSLKTRKKTVLKDARAALILVGKISKSKILNLCLHEDQLSFRVVDTEKCPAEYTQLNK